MKRNKIVRALKPLDLERLTGRSRMAVEAKKEKLQNELAKNAQLVIKLEAVKKFLNDLIASDQKVQSDGENTTMVDGVYAQRARLLIEEIDQ